MFALLKGKTTPGLTGIGLLPDGICLVRVVRDAGPRPRLTDWVFRPMESNQNQEKILASLAREYDLKRMPCTTVLSEGEYKLLLTEAPDVKPEELRAAIRWRIKDLIDFHIQDAALDVFDLPGIRVPGAAREMYVVAARNQAIQKRVDLLDAAAINLDVIDIPELAQRNVTAQLPDDAQGIVLLSLQARGGLITVTRQGMLYLSRALNVDLKALVSADNRSDYFDQIVLEIQRSLDYFESHFRQPPIQHLVVAPMAEEVPDLISYLNNNLNVRATHLDLSQVLDIATDIPPAMQARCFTTLGAALRQEVKAL